MTKKLTLLVFAVSLLVESALCSAATPYRYCFIGDSRFVGMQQMVDTDEDITWVAKVGARHDWYWQNRDYIADLDKDTVIVYELGVNSLDAGACIEALQDLENLGFQHIYFTSVTPVDEAKEARYGYSVTNSRIEEFNKAVRENIPYSIAAMDSYEYLSAMGIDTEDGLHYTGYTYQIWLDNILSSL